MGSRSDIRLRGDQIELRYLTEADASDLYANWMNDTAINRYLESRFSEQTAESVRCFIRQARNNDDVHLFGMFLKPGWAHIGNIKLGPVHPHYGTGDIGLLIGDRNAWGRGIATEAIRLISGFAFGTLGLRRVTAGAYGRNGGCIRAFEKAGFRREGVLRSEVIGADGMPDDVVKLGLMSEEFKP